MHRTAIALAFEVLNDGDYDVQASTSTRVSEKSLYVEVFLEACS
jgi:hypothetical protein